MSNKIYSVELTESEVITIREALRKYPIGNEFRLLYAPEFFGLDEKMSDILVDVFDDKYM